MELGTIGGSGLHPSAVMVTGRATSTLALVAKPSGGRQVQFRNLLILQTILMLILARIMHVRSPLFLFLSRFWFFFFFLGRSAGFGLTRCTRTSLGDLAPISCDSISKYSQPIVILNILDSALYPRMAL